jgi:peroxiredoxin
LGIGTQAPDFTAETLDGQLVSSATYSRESVLFVFVSPTCDPCIEKIGMFNKLYFQAKQHGVNIILVCLASKGETQVFADKYSIEVPMLVAPPENNSFMKSYKAPGTPFYCFVSNEGKVQSTGLLDSNWDQLVQKWGADD